MFRRKIANTYFHLIPSHPIQVMVTIDDVKGPRMSKGILLALMSAFFYAAYLVLVKRKSDTEEKIDIPLFFGKFRNQFFVVHLLRIVHQ